MQIWKKLITVVTAGGILASQCVAGGLKNIWMAAASAANAAVIYDAADFSTFQDRTLQDVAEAYAEARYAGETYVNGDSSTYYLEAPSFSDPYNGGVLTEDTHLAMTAMTNFYRWLIGANPLTEVSQHSAQLQAGALVRNYDFNHSVSDENKPDDMSDAFWEYGAGCPHNILALRSTPQGAITNFMNEGYTLSTQAWHTVGHRYAMMSMSLSDIQYGYCGSVTIGKMASNNNTPKEAFTAFPAPGYMPNNLIFPTASAWSVELDTTKIAVPDEENLTVTVENLTTGESYVCSSETDTAKYTYSMGAPVILFTQPSDYDESSYDYVDSYAVTIHGLQDVETEKAAEIQYTVNFFDVNEYATSYVKSYTLPFSNYVIYETMDSTENLEKIGTVLDKEIQITTETGKTVTVPLAGEWKLDEANSCWTNTVDPTVLPTGITDKNGILEQIVQPYKISNDKYDYYNTLSISPSVITVGESCTMSVYRTMSSAPYSSIFKLTENADGSYGAEEKYNSETSPEFDAEKSATTGYYHVYHIYSISNCTEEDSGDYISVYYSPKYTGWSAYVSKSIQSLTVLPYVTTTATEMTTTETTTTTTVATTSRAATTPTSTTTFTETTTQQTEESTCYGDINLDGRMDLTDAILLNKALAGAIKLNAQALQNADCNANGELDGRDAIALLRFLVHVIDVLPDAA